MSPHAHLLSCGFLRISIELHNPLLVGFFVVVGFCFLFLIFLPDLELKPSIHFTDNLILKSSQQQLPQPAPGFCPLHQLSQLLWERRFICCDMSESFFIKKAMRGVSLDTHYTSLCPSWRQMNKPCCDC